MRKTIFRMIALLCIGGTHMLSATAQTNNATVGQADDNSAFTFTESQLGEDDDAVQSVAALTSSTNDIYLSNVGYLFSPMRFKVRGYDSKYNDVYINGVQMNDMETGRFSYGMVGGLNHATKNQEGVSPFEDNRFAFAPIGGASNINMRASQYATGSNLTLSACNRNYLARAIFTHSTGMMDNGWALTFSLAYRWANEGVIEGTFYNSLGGFLSAEKQFNDQHSLSMSFFAVPTERAQQGAATEETYALAGSHYYNPYWGYQNGVKRNARVVNTFEPTGILTWDFDIDEYRKLTTTAAMKYSQYGTTALGWNGNAADPRPDYYKKLPSSAYNVWDLDYSPTADEVSSYMDIYDHFTSAKANRQIDWDMMYFANQQGNAQGLDALYYVEERHNDQAALNLSSTWSHTINNYNRYNLGVNASTTKGMHYKTMSDLLGANSYTDIDKFAARDNGLTNPIIQNDLRNPNRQISEGDVFGYNYNIYVNKARAWGQYLYTYGPLRAVVSGQINGTTIEREGLMQNGRAAERSYGSSGVAKFLGGGGKATLSWRINPSNVLTLNSSYQREAPLAYNSFVANRIKNDFVHGLSTEGIFNNELSYSLTTARFTARLSGYYTRFTDQVEQTAFYNDSEARFTYLTMRGVEKEHYGIEAAAIWNVTSALSFTFIGSMGDALYTNNPYATITYESQDEVSMTYTNPVTKKLDALLVIADGCRVSSTPLTALSLGIDYNVNGWFLGANVNYYDRVYVDFSEFRRLSNILTPYISSGAVDANGNPSFGVDEATLATNGGILYNEDGSIYKAQTAEQTCVKGGFLVDLNVGRYIRLKNGRSLSLNLTVNNLLNNTNMSTGGYEQNRGDYYYDNGEQGDARTYVFSKNPKLYYANAFNAFFNVAYKF